MKGGKYEPSERLHYEVRGAGRTVHDLGPSRNWQDILYL